MVLMMGREEVVMVGGRRQRHTVGQIFILRSRSWYVYFSNRMAM